MPDQETPDSATLRWWRDCLKELPPSDAEKLADILDDVMAALNRVYTTSGLAAKFVEEHLGKHTGYRMRASRACGLLADVENYDEGMYSEDWIEQLNLVAEVCDDVDKW